MKKYFKNLNGVSLFLFSLCFLLLISFPAKVSAADLFDLFDDILSIIDYLVLIVMGLALVFFLWGMAKFILHAGNETDRENGKQVMLWGLIALFVMTSVWGIINFMQGEIFGGSPEDEPFDLITPPDP
ncbi:MAG: pilin [Candidatus Paceibacterota bacterium]